MTIGQLYNHIKSCVACYEDGHEAQSIALILMEEYYGVTRSDLILSADTPAAVTSNLEEALAKLESGVPLQYILGHGHFYGRSFHVSPSVLIPRGESEELVRLILDQRAGGRLLDIGTGSGALAITLALECDGFRCSGCDISRGALAVAQENGKLLGADVDFFYCDILSDTIEQGYDIIVSNPPYILNSEKALMRPKVYDHEPHQALFVDDSTPLLFYERIAELATTSLNDGGGLYFEINESQGAATRRMLLDKGFSDVAIIKDLMGKERMASALWSNGK